MVIKAFFSSSSLHHYFVFKKKFSSEVCKPSFLLWLLACFILFLRTRKRDREDRHEFSDTHELDCRIEDCLLLL